MERGVQPRLMVSCGSEATAGSVEGTGRQTAGMWTKDTVTWGKSERRGAAENVRVDPRRVTGLQAVRPWCPNR